MIVRINSATAKAHAGKLILGVPVLMTKNVIAIYAVAESVLKILTAIHVLITPSAKAARVTAAVSVMIIFQMERLAPLNIIVSAVIATV